MGATISKFILMKFSVEKGKFSCILSSWWIANRIPCCSVSDPIYFAPHESEFRRDEIVVKTFWTSRWIRLASPIKSSLKFNLTLWIIDFEFCDWNVFRRKSADVSKLPTWSIGCDSKMFSGLRRGGGAQTSWQMHDSMGKMGERNKNLLSTTRNFFNLKGMFFGPIRLAARCHYAYFGLNAMVKADVVIPFYLYFNQQWLESEHSCVHDFWLAGWLADRFIFVEFLNIWF